MSFYDLDKDERIKVVAKITSEILKDLKTSSTKNTLLYFSDEDTYIRKTAYLTLGKIYKTKKNSVFPF